jgi:glycosyltransferase involved in cell wall biosynthesis
MLTSVIPVYNGEAYLAETLDSLARQSRLPDRLVILDNCSTDATPDIAQKCRLHSRLEYRRNETNIGGPNNFNRALDLAEETDYLHIISADDLVEPGFFARLLPTIDDVNGRAMAFSGLTFIDEQGAVLKTCAASAGRPRTLSRNRFLRRQAELRHVYCQSVVLKTARMPSPVRYRTDWRQAADVVLFSEWAVLCNRIVEVREPLCRYRIHPVSTTSGNLSSLEAWVLEEWRAMQRVAALIDEAWPVRWLRRQRLKCIFAARSRVKMSQVGQTQPAYAREIGERARATVGEIPWRLGGAAVRVRDYWRRG